jgi:hypothetical protein
MPDVRELGSVSLELLYGDRHTERVKPIGVFLQIFTKNDPISRDEFFRGSTLVTESIFSVFKTKYSCLRILRRFHCIYCTVFI